MERKDNKADLQDFINSDLGELWKSEPKKSISKEKIYEIRDRNKYKRGTIPTDQKFFLLTVVDIQQSHIVYGIWAMGHSDSWLIDHGYVSVLEDIPAKSAGPFFDLEGNEHVCTREMYDSGYRTTEVYKWVLKSPRQRLALKGEKGRITSQTAPVRPQKLGNMPNGKPLPYGSALILHHIHPSYFKDELAEALNPQEVLNDDGEVMDIPMDELDFRIHFHEDIDADFVDQIVGEILVSDDPDKFGVEKQYWKKIGKNDFFDVAQYMMAARYMARSELQALKHVKGDAEENEPEEKEKDRPVQDNGVSYGQDDDW
jgi:phage terminase large subunit GpA-like protein